jgi:hypothetical protein
MKGNHASQRQFLELNHQEVILVPKYTARAATHKATDGIADLVAVSFVHWVFQLILIKGGYRNTFHNVMRIISLTK